MSTPSIAKLLPLFGPEYAEHPNHRLHMIVPRDGCAAILNV